MTAVSAVSRQKSQQQDSDLGWRPQQNFSSQVLVLPQTVLHFQNLIAFLLNNQNFYTRRCMRTLLQFLLQQAETFIKTFRHHIDPVSCTRVRARVALLSPH